MAAQILSFAAARLREPASRDWSSQELAEFYRVESALMQAGLALESERGLSDEGEPWFVFCRVDTGEVFIHFARVDGVYVVDGAAFGSPARGRDFGALVRDLISSHPLATVRRPGSNVMMHPAALLIALVGAAFFHSGKAKAAEPVDHSAGATDARAGERRAVIFNTGGPAPTADSGARAVSLDAGEVAAVLTGVAIALREVTPAAASSLPAVGLDTMPGLLSEAVAHAGRALDAHAALSSLSAPDARAALLVMAVFHDLARNTAASIVAAASSTASAAVPTGSAFLSDVAFNTGGGGGGAGGGATPPGPPGGPPGPTVLVHLAAGPLPQIEALALVSADGALAHVSADRVVHVEQLPVLLSDLIARGEILAVAGATPPAGDPTPDAVTGVVTGDHGATDLQHQTPVAPPPATSGDHTTTPVTVAPPAPHDGASGTDTGGSTGAAPVAPPVIAPVVQSHASVMAAQIDAAVLAFVSQVADVKVMVSGHEVVFYDPAILSMLAPGEAPDSITWRLEDGSSVSLVGTVSELHAAHGVG